MPSPFDARSWDATVKGGYAPPEGWADPVRQRQAAAGHAPQREVGDLLREQAERYDYEQQLRLEAGMSVDPRTIDPRERNTEPRPHEHMSGPCEECLPTIRKAQLIGVVTGFLIGAGAIGMIAYSFRGRTVVETDYVPADIAA